MMNSRVVDSSIEKDRQNSAIESTALFGNLVDIIKPSYFLEIGAMDAHFSRSLSTVIPSCSFHAFEANPHTYKHFYNLMSQHSNVSYQNKAVGSYTGKVEFKIQKSVNGDSVPPIRGNNSVLERTLQSIEYENVVVDVDTIDNMFSDTYLDKKFAMWIDVEGTAFDVLQGAQNVLKNTDLAFIEVEDFPFWKNQKLATDVVKYMYDRSFLPIARDFQYDSQYNIIFCHANLLQSNFRIRNAIASYYAHK